MAMPADSGFMLTSDVFEDRDTIPEQYTCKGKNVSPPLKISGVPDGAKSLALIVHDPDAVGSDWVHWLVWNIPPATRTIGEGNMPDGAMEGMTSFDSTGYGGPCPPAGTGTHRYMFELYALDIAPGLPITTHRDALLGFMQGHILDQTALTGLFSAD